LVTETDNLSPTPGAEKEYCAAKNKVNATTKNAKVRFTTGFYSRFRAANEPAPASSRGIFVGRR
jgi:hypothetical protein